MKGGVGCLLSFDHSINLYHDLHTVIIKSNKNVINRVFRLRRSEERTSWGARSAGLGGVLEYQR